jgi:hypothetical protein
MENTAVPKVKFTAPNHCIIAMGSDTVFQSYNSIVAKCDNGKYTLGRDWDYSNTTLRHLCADYIPSYIAYDKKSMLKAIKE